MKIDRGVIPLTLPLPLEVKMPNAFTYYRLVDPTGKVYATSENRCLLEDLLAGGGYEDIRKEEGHLVENLVTFPEGCRIVEVVK